MDTVCGRLKGAMLAAGTEPTPESLARVTGMSLEEAREVFALSADMPRAVINLAHACRSLKVRTLWVLTAATCPQTRGSLTHDDVKALSAVESLGAEDRRRWLRFAERMLGK